MRPEILFLLFFSSSLWANQTCREWGTVVGNYPTGKLNAITDVAGVRVGHVTLNSGNGKLITGKGPVRTGVTVIIPGDGDIWSSGLAAGSFVFNGFGEAMGLAGLRETGTLRGPIALTNTLSVGDVQKALVRWILKLHPELESPLPVVLECDDSTLNDIHGFHVHSEHVFSAIKSATREFAEGAVGAGTGMATFDFKSGIGSSSRIVTLETGEKYTVGVLVNANLGTQTRDAFQFRGRQIGKQIKDLMPVEHPIAKPKGAGSVVALVATDAPLDSAQLDRLAKRAMSGIIRLGSPGYNGSGDFIIAYSTANRIPEKAKKAFVNLRRLLESSLNPLFEAVADATEESVLNSLLNAKTTTGRDDNVVYGLPGERWKKAIE